jgi:hypothetical protein
MQGLSNWNDIGNQSHIKDEGMGGGESEVRRGERR